MMFQHQNSRELIDTHQAFILIDIRPQITKIIQVYGPYLIVREPAVYLQGTSRPFIRYHQPYIYQPAQLGMPSTLIQFQTLNQILTLPLGSLHTLDGRCVLSQQQLYHFRDRLSDGVENLETIAAGLIHTLLQIILSRHLAYQSALTYDRLFSWLAIQNEDLEEVITDLEEILIQPIHQLREWVFPYRWYIHFLDNHGDALYLERCHDWRAYQYLLEREQRDEEQQRQRLNEV